MTEKLPTYSLSSFSRSLDRSALYRAEVFDANRHFEVTYPHRHDFYEVLYIRHGSGLHTIDSNSYAVEPPCVFFMSPGQAHKLDLSQDIEGYIFLFAAEFYLISRTNKNRLLEFPFFFTLHQDNPPLYLGGIEQRSFIETLFVNAVSECSRTAEPPEELLRSILDTLLVSCASVYGQNLPRLAGRGHILVKRFLQLSEEHFRENITVDTYAKLLAVTPGHLTQVVRELTGRTSNEILRDKQILEAKRLLSHTSLSVTQIAEQMGFDDQSYFTKFFKKSAGMTPVQFRRKAAE